MVSKETIETVINKSISIVKCHDYPKARALREFQEKTWSTEDYGYGVNTRTLPSPVGRLQKIQADLQEEIEYTGLEKGVIKDYSTNSFIPLGLMLNGVKDWEDICEFIGYDFGNGFVMPVIDYDKKEEEDVSPYVEMSMPQESEILSKMIDKSPRVQEDCIVYRYGELPLDIKEGEHGKFNSFLSTSYNDFVAFEDIPEGGQWVQSEAIKKKRYKMRIYTPTGTKGIVLNRHVKCRDWQSELLIDKGQRYIVLSKNDKDMTADILLY